MKLLNSSLGLHVPAHTSPSLYNKLLERTIIKYTAASPGSVKVRALTAHNSTQLCPQPRTAREAQGGPGLLVLEPREPTGSTGGSAQSTNINASFFLLFTGIGSHEAEHNTLTERAISAESRRCSHAARRSSFA